MPGGNFRRFRDETLAATWYGRAFIRCYYAVSLFAYSVMWVWLKMWSSQ